MTLSERLRKVINFDERGKELVTEFRYACYPDADKDELQTLLADYGCHGFEAGLGVRFDRIRPLLEELVKYVKAVDNYMGTTNMNAYDLLIDTRANLEKVVAGMEER